MNVIYVGPITDSGSKDGGYNRAAESFILMLKKAEELKIIDELLVVESSSFIIPQVTKKYDVLILLTHPNSFFIPQTSAFFQHLLKLADKKYLHIFWETNSLPIAWNFLWDKELFDGFIASSDFVKHLIEDKTNKSVFKIPLYIDVNRFDKLNIEEKLNEEIFTVLYIGQNTKRKGLDDAIISFVRSLGQFSDCQLIVKYHELGQPIISFDLLIQYYIHTNCIQPKAKIYATTDNMNFEKINQLYKKSSILLFPSRGEGFGLPPLEAMSIGIPVIYTGWSSLPEVAQGFGNIEISYHMDSTVGMAQYGYGLDSGYAIPSMFHLMGALLSSYQKWKTNKIDYYIECIDNHKIVDEKFGIEKCLEYLKLFLGKG